MLARGVTDGPDADIDHMRQVILGGVLVDIVLPVRSNLPLMDWAIRPQFNELVGSGCRVHLTGPDFDHTKLFLVDDAWSLIGSTNWDARSLRLNFEYNLQCHDTGLVRQFDVLVDERIARAHRLINAELVGQSLQGCLRDRLVWLLSPYL